MMKPDASERSRRTRLLAEMFHDNWDQGELAGHARLAASRARRRHHLRRGLLTATTAGAALLVALTFGRHHGPGSAPAASATPRPPAYEIISDDEFLARISEQPVIALQREDGTREFILPERDAANFPAN